MPRLSIVMYVPGMEFHARSLSEHSLGGSETAGLSVALELQKLGHDVRVFCRTKQAHKAEGGTEFVPIEHFQRYALVIPHDVCIAQRAPNVFGTRMESKLNVLWVHDLAMLRQMQEVRGSIWNIDRVFTVSKYHAEQYKSVFDLPDEIMYPTRNGIHLDMVPPVGLKRNPKQVVYTARPERGLDVLLENILPRVWEADPEVKLVVAAYDNTVEEMIPFYAHLHQLMAKYGDRVQVAGALTKPDLYKLYAESALYLYPTPSPVNPLFNEVSCITAMECMMCGLPFISTKRGALPETLAAGAGALLEGEPSTEDYQERFTGAVLELLGNEGMRESMSRAGREHAKTLDWSGVAKDWAEKFVSWCEERSVNKHALTRHLLRQSDVIAAEALAKENNDQESLNTIDEHYGWYRNAADYVEHYEKIGATHTDVFEETAQEPRFGAVIERLMAKGVKSGRLLDFGCAHGSYAVHFSNNLPDLKITGVDVDKFGIEWSEKHKANHAEHPENLEFRLIEGPEDLYDDEPYDALYVGEVLEHVAEPWVLLEKLERLVKPGGMMFITTPYGPWEEDSFRTYPHRCHLWELDFFALRDMLAERAGKALEIQQAFLGHSQTQLKPLGINIATYPVTEKAKVHPVSMYRKHNLQPVRQTVSVSMICGPGAEQMLAWCLDSVQDVADELIIGDTGMSDAGREIAMKYGARLVPAPDPKVEGFDEARNATLPHCKMDWVLWIDSDERLINPEHLHKYLRPNIFGGYGIKQHHFSCDAAFNPDLPVRIFRNHRGLKFFGSCHEHPEMELNKGPGLSIVLADVHIAHVGYLSEGVRQERFGRNHPLMDLSRKKFPDRLLNKYFTMRDNMLMVNYELQNNGGRPSDTVRARIDETIDLYREHFLGTANFMAKEAVKYYSEACRVLGIGAEVALAVNSAKQGEPGKAVETLRYGCVDDLQKDLSARAKEALEQFCNPMW